jgi:hypothetical protein
MCFAAHEKWYNRQAMQRAILLLTPPPTTQKMEQIVFVVIIIVRFFALFTKIKTFTHKINIRRGAFTLFVQWKTAFNHRN